MKLMKYMISLFLCIILLGGFMVSEVYASGFITNDVAPDEKERILSKEYIQITWTQPPLDGIECFDVNEHGWVALGFSNMNEKTVCIYNSDFLFQHAFQFQSSGNYGIGWAGENLLIYIVRSDYSFEIRPDGEIADIKKIPTTTENNRYWNNVVYSAKREVNGTQYKLSNDLGILNIFANSYSQLYVTYPTGEQVLLYDANKIQLKTVLTWMIMIIAFVSICMLTFFFQMRKSSREKEDNVDS